MGSWPAYYTLCLKSNQLSFHRNASFWMYFCRVLPIWCKFGSSLKENTLPKKWPYYRFQHKLHNFIITRKYKQVISIRPAWHGHFKKNKAKNKAEKKRQPLMLILQLHYPWAFALVHPLKLIWAPIQTWW